MFVSDSLLYYPGLMPQAISDLIAKRMNRFSDPKSFWEEKILTWERDRYGEGSASSALESVARGAGKSLHRRMKLAEEILKPHIPGQRIVELGCGSGLLAERLMDAGARTYTGFDIAGPAIEIARQKADEKGLSEVVRFEIGEVKGLGSVDADIVFSLGLTDWLSDDDIEKLFSHFRGVRFLHSISEKRLSVTQLLHRLYCYVSYGYKTQGYVPRYLNISKIAAIAKAAGAGDMNVIRDSEMKFGIFVTSLPLPK